VAKDLKDRTKKFAIDVIRFCMRLPREQEFRVIGRQLIRCASSVGANYRAASRARSKPDFIAKLGIVEEEADEVCYWLEILEGLGMTEAKEIDPLKSEANELISIIIASKKTARANLAKASRPDR
jgi:four helix bundle protein